MNTLLRFRLKSVLRCWQLAARAAALALFLVPAPARPQATMPAGGHDVFAYTHATAVSGCARGGVAVLEVFLTRTPLSPSGQPSPPFVRFDIPSGLSDDVPAGSYSLATAAPNAPQPATLPRVAFVAEGQRPIWLGGSFRVNSMEPGRYLNGHFRVEMPDGKVAESGFLARYFTGKASCGE